MTLSTSETMLTLVNYDISNRGLIWFDFFFCENNNRISGNINYILPLIIDFSVRLLFGLYVFFLMLADWILRGLYVEKIQTIKLAKTLKGQITYYWINESVTLIVEVHMYL